MNEPVWNSFQKIGFRFLFIFFLLMASPWDWIPWIGDFTGSIRYYPSFFVQNYILNLHDQPVWTHAPTGSGDTIDDWVLCLTWFAVAVVSCIIWSLTDSKRKNYSRLNYWFRVGLRYYIAVVLFFYGFDKIFPIQMPFPSLAQLNTPLGDLSPMRLAWLFIGYSAPYQIFGGLLETLAAVLFAIRKTQLLGGLMMLGVLANVVMLNFSYDIPVKLFSSQLLLMTLYVVLYDYKRLLDFFVFNRATQPADLGPAFTSKRDKYIRWALIGSFWIFGFGYAAYQNYGFWKQRTNVPPFSLYGNYEVKSFLKNNHAVDNLDTLRWNYVVMSHGFQAHEGRGMIRRGTNQSDRATFLVDSLKNFHVVFRDDTTRNFKGRYKKLNDLEISLRGVVDEDSLSVHLVKSNHQFKLETKPFHWISAYPY